MILRNPAELFAEQFEPTETGYLYRKDRRCAPVEVTKAERDAFVEAFARSARLQRWGLLGAAILIIFALVTIETVFDIDVPEWSTFLSTIVLVAGFTFAWSRSWNAPSSVVKSRPPVGPAPSRAELERVTFSQLSWRLVIYWWLVTLVGVLANLPSGRGSMNTVSWGSLLFFGVAFLAGCFLVISKLRLSR
jgi:hypothetical protein